MGAKDSKFRKICMARLRQSSPKIIVSNIPDGKEDMVKKHIIEAGYTVKDMQGSKKTDAPKTEFTRQIVELASTEEAIGAVANLHNSWLKKMGTNIFEVMLKFYNLHKEYQDMKEWLRRIGEDVMLV